MAAHHHHVNHSYQPSCSSCCCSSCCRSCCSSNPHATPPPPSPTDPLLQEIATQVLHSHYFKPHNPLPNHSPKHPQQATQSLLLLQSLLRRVAALETSLRRISTSAPNPSPAFSLRDAAARIIQTRFRIFLARRSQTLRHLKHLASVKSNLADLKSSLSSKDRLWVLQKAASLIQQLESIQSRDSMIREGKKTISRELARLMELLNGMVAKRQEATSKSVKKVIFSEIDNHSGAFTNAYDRFPDTKHARNIAGMNCELSREDEINLVDELSREIERIERLSRVVEQDDRGLDVELEGFEQFSDDERKARKDWKSGRNEYFPRENGNLGLPAEDSCGSNRINQMQGINLGLSAPLPVKMEESRGSGLGNKKKVVRLIG